MKKVILRGKGVVTRRLELLSSNIALPVSILVLAYTVSLKQAPE